MNNFLEHFGLWSKNWRCKCLNLRFWSSNSKKKFKPLFSIFVNHPILCAWTAITKKKSYTFIEPLKIYTSQNLSLKFTFCFHRVLAIKNNWPQLQRKCSKKSFFLGKVCLICTKKRSYLNNLNFKKMLRFLN